MLLDDFKNNIIKNIQESNLPIDAIYFVLRDIMHEVIDNYNQVLEQEKNAKMAVQAEKQPESVSNEADSTADNIEKKEEN